MKRRWVWLGLAGLAFWGWTVLNPRRPYDLKGRVVLITGGSRGLGLQLAREMGRGGARVAICARNARELAFAVHDLQRRKIDALGIRCDVRDREAVNHLIDHVISHFGKLDVLVNNAGTIQVGPMATMSPADFEQIMAANFHGAVYATFAALPHFRDRRQGRIVNIVSLGGRVAMPHLLPYTCSKYALMGFSEGLHAELAKDNIHVLTVAPGLMRTGSPLNAYFKGQAGKEFSWFTWLDNTFLTAIDARRAARLIVGALNDGETFLTFTWQAKCLDQLHQFFPWFTADLLGWVNRLLPRADGLGQAALRGADIPHDAVWPGTFGLVSKPGSQFNQFAGLKEGPIPISEGRTGID